MINHAQMLATHIKPTTSQNIANTNSEAPLPAHQQETQSPRSILTVFKRIPLTLHSPFYPFIHKHTPQHLPMPLPSRSAPSSQPY